MPSQEALALAVRLGDVLGAAAAPASVEDRLRQATAAVRGLLGAAACSVALLLPDGETLRFAAADGAGAARIVGVEIGTDRGIAGWVATSGQAVAIADVRRDPRFARDVAESTDYVPSSIMAAPLLDAAGEVLGVIEVLDRAGDASTGRDLDVLAVVAAQLAAVVELAGRFDRLGAVVVAGLTGDAGDEQVAARMADEAGRQDDAELAAIASAVGRLAALGPSGRRLVQRVLDAVADDRRSRP